MLQRLTWTGWLVLLVMAQAGCGSGERRQERQRLARKACFAKAAVDSLSEMMADMNQEKVRRDAGFDSLQQAYVEASRRNRQIRAHRTGLAAEEGTLEHEVVVAALAAGMIARVTDDADPEEKKLVESALAEVDSLKQEIRRTHQRAERTAREARDQRDLARVQMTELDGRLAVLDAVVEYAGILLKGHILADSAFVATGAASVRLSDQSSAQLQRGAAHSSAEPRIAAAYQEILSELVASDTHPCHQAAR